MYIANSAFEHKGRAYRPGEVLTDNDGCEELIKVGFVVVLDDPDTPGKQVEPDEPDKPDEPVAPITPVATIGRNNLKKSGRKR